MTEWVLPPDETPGLRAALLDGARARDDPAARFLRGGFWRNFQARYREINDLHKQMLRASDKVDAMADGPTDARASTTSTRASRTTATGTGCSAGSTSSTCAWRRCAHLIAAEDLADSATAAGGGAVTRWRNRMARV